MDSKFSRSIQKCAQALTFLIKEENEFGRYMAKGFTQTASELTLGQRITIERYNLTDCAFAKDAASATPTIGMLTKIKLGNKLLNHMACHNFLIGQYKGTRGNTDAFCCSDTKVVGIKPWLSTTAHEAFHTIQSCEYSWHELTKNYQRKTANELGAYCFGIMSLYMCPTYDTIVPSLRTLAERQIGSQLNFQLKATSRRKQEKLKDPTQMPAADFMDRLMTTTLNFLVFKRAVKAPFYKNNLKLSPFNLRPLFPSRYDFTPLTKTEVETALVGDLYPSGSFPQTVKAIQKIGNQASNMQWFKENICPR